MLSYKKHHFVSLLKYVLVCYIIVIYGRDKKITSQLFIIIIIDRECEIQYFKTI